jgi:hypothetical protein
VKVNRSQIVQRLREAGKDEEAERALAELPDHFELREFQDNLRSYGIDPEAWRLQRQLWLGGGGHAGGEW